MSLYQSRRDAADLLDFAGVLGFLIALGLGIMMRFDALLTIYAASSYLVVCFLSSALLSTLWKIPRSLE